MNQALLQQLFFREQFNQRLELEQLSSIQSHEVEFNQWQKNKRAFDIEEIKGAVWTKTCAQGHITEMVFNADGTLDEFTLYERNHLKGQWLLVDGILHVTINTTNHVYTFAVIASNQSSIHHAIEFEDDHWHAFLKIMQLCPPINMAS